MKPGSTILAPKQGHKTWNSTMLCLQSPEPCHWPGKLWELSFGVLVDFMSSGETINATHYTYTCHKLQCAFCDE